MKSAIRVLVPLDGSPLAESVLGYLGDLGAPDVTLLRVVEPSLVVSVDEGDLRERERSLAPVAARLRAGLHGPVGRVETLVRAGDPAEEIALAAEEMGADLIALTTHGRTGFDRFVLGSVAETLVRTSKTPLLALRAVEPLPPTEARPPLFARTLLAHDGSEHAERALDVLLRLNAGRGGRLLLLGVIETMDPDGAAPDPSSPDLRKRYLGLLARDLEARLAGPAEKARAAGVEAGVEVVCGRPAAKILDRAEALSASLLALGTHGRSGIARWALGSVAEKVLRAAPGPVLTVR